jgi:hypothetical protein
MKHLKKYRSYSQNLLQMIVWKGGLTDKVQTSSYINLVMIRHPCLKNHYNIVVRSIVNPLSPILNAVNVLIAVIKISRV